MKLEKLNQKLQRGPILKMIDEKTRKKIEEIVRVEGSAVVELSSEEQVAFDREGLRAMGYEISNEVKDGEHYHIHIKKFPEYQNA